MMKKIFIIVGIIAWIAWGLLLFWPDYTIQNMVLEETKDIKLPSTCVRWQTNDGDSSFRVQFAEPLDSKDGIASIEQQLLRKGFVRVNSRTLSKGKFKAFRFELNGKTILLIDYGDK